MAGKKKKISRLARVNATLDRFAKLIEENAEQLRMDKAEARRQRAKDKAEARQQRAKDKAEARQQRAEDRADAKRRQEEADRRQEEADRRQEEADRRRKEDKRRREEDDRRREEADRRLKENEYLISNLGKNIRGLGVSIGEITEAITVSSKIIELVNGFEGIEVDSFVPNLEKTYMLDPAGKLEGDNRKQFEIDGLAIGKSEAVVIEAKTKLNKRDVVSFIKRLARFKQAFSEYADRDIYACVAFVRSTDLALNYAEKQGLFVIRTSPPDIELVNDKNFIPIKFA